MSQTDLGEVWARSLEELSDLQIRELLKRSRPYLPQIGLTHRVTTLRPHMPINSLFHSLCTPCSGQCPVPVSRCAAGPCRVVLRAG